MRSLRILQLMSCRGWSSDAYWAGRLTRELHERGHRVTFVARAGTEEKVLSRLRALGVQDLRTLPFLGRRAPIGAGMDLVAIRRLIGEHDVLHVHRGKEHWIGAVANLWAPRRIPLIRTRHIVHRVRAHPLNRWLYRRATDHLITVSQEIRERYVASGLLPPWRVTPLAGGVDHRTFHPKVDGAEFRRAHGLALEAPVVGLLASLRPMKGHRVFLEAARRVSASHPGTRFLLVGEGRDAGLIRQLVAELGLTRTVVMAGFARDPERALAAFTIGVYPSLSSEGMGRVLFEYMAMGLPIVASSVGLAPEVLTDRETALLVPPGEPEPLARAIQTALTSPGFAAGAGQKCCQLVEERYSGAALAEAVEAIYRASISRGAGASSAQ